MLLAYTKVPAFIAWDQASLWEENGKKRSESRSAHFARRFFFPLFFSNSEPGPQQFGFFEMDLFTVQNHQR